METHPSQIAQHVEKTSSMKLKCASRFIIAIFLIVQKTAWKADDNKQNTLY